MGDIIFSDYKCFKNKTKIEGLNLINLFIGKNNCGKTTTIEIIKMVYGDDKPRENKSKILYETQLNDQFICSCYSPNTYSFYSLGQRLSDRDIALQSLRGLKFAFPFKGCKENEGDFKSFNAIKEINDITHWKALTTAAVNSIKKYHFYDIAAERDIRVEERTKDFSVDKNGGGLTRLFNYHIHDTNGKFEIKEEILNSLNEIMKGEDSYTGIDVLDTGENKLALYLYLGQERIPLEEMGSGLKTILFVLILLHLSIKEHNNPAFAFEELENNLHPEIQRRLFEFIYNFATKHKTPVCITSHSHVAINLFYKRENASVFHILKKDSSSTIEKIDNDVSKSIILSDLGVQASDLFQSNGIIWVEGPSDRIYIKKWIELYDQSIEENRHYTFLYYGGKILSHFSANTIDTNGLISILLTNKNSIVVIDHDENSENDPIRETKQRVKDEMEKAKKIVWITKGKEIENYIDAKAINSSFENSKPLRQVKPFKKFSEYIKSIDSSFESHKVEFANDVSKNMNDASLNILDLKDKINEIVEQIKSWNYLK